MYVVDSPKITSSRVIRFGNRSLLLIQFKEVAQKSHLFRESDYSYVLKSQSHPSLHYSTNKVHLKK